MRWYMSGVGGIRFDVIGKFVIVMFIREVCCVGFVCKMVLFGGKYVLVVNFFEWFM